MRAREEDSRAEAQRRREEGETAEGRRGGGIHEKVILGSVADVNWGDTSVTKEKYVLAGFPAYSATGFDGYLPYFDHDRDAVVLSAIGARCGKTWYASGKWSCIKNTIRFWSTDKDLDDRFLFWATSNPEAWPKRGAAQPFITIGDARQIPIPLPPLPEQRRIAAILDQAEALRSQRKKALGLLDELTRSVFLEMFGGENTILVNWPVKPLGELLDFLTSGSRGWAEYYSVAGDKFLRIQNVLRDDISLEDIAFVTPPNSAEARRTKVQPGDVLLSITADLGRTCVVPNNIGTAYINQHLSILRTKRLHPRFLSAFLSCPKGQRQVHGRNKMGVKAGLNFDDLRSFSIPLPPLPLQQEFARRVAVIEALKANHKQALAKLDELFASLQHRAFRGELTSGMMESTSEGSTHAH